MLCVSSDQDGTEPSLLWLRTACVHPSSIVHHRYFCEYLRAVLCFWVHFGSETVLHWKWQRGVVEHPLSESHWNRGHFSMKKWESEKHKSCMPAERFKSHVAADGSLLGTAGEWRACGRSVVQLDYDEELESLHGMYGSMAADVEVQHTIKRAELTTFVCLLKKVTGLIKVHVGNK